MLKTVIGIQARSGSERLKHKSLQNIGDSTIIEHCYSICKQTGCDTYVLPPKDDRVIIEFCKHRKLDHYVCHDAEGENDVLSRYMGLFDTTGADRIVRVTGDCPFPFLIMLDWEIRNSVAVDFMSNAFAPRHIPDGWDCEIMSAHALEWLHKNSNVANREHVTQAIYQMEQDFIDDGLSVAKINYPLDLSGIKLSIDTKADLENVRRMYPQ